MSHLKTFISILALTVVCLNGQAANASRDNTNATMIAVTSDKDYDPGKEATDDPHGPNPHGPNPHGRDPADEVHDRNVPANNPDPYLNSPPNSRLY